MATELKKIVLRRGTGTPPTDLAEGELAFQTDTDKLFVGTGLASPNHYKQVANLADMGVTVSKDDINLLDGASANIQEQIDGKAPSVHQHLLASVTDVTATAAEVNKLDGFTGTVDDLNYAKDLRATGVTATEFDYLDGVTSNIQDQLNAVSPEFSEWSAVTSKLQTNNASTLVVDGNTTTFDWSNYDYKFVYDAWTSAEDNDEVSFYFNNADTQGVHSFVYHKVQIITASSEAETIQGDFGGLGGINIQTGLNLHSVSTGENTYLQLEFTVSRPATLIANPPFIVMGKGAAMSGEGDSQNVLTTYSGTTLVNFSGSYAGGNITSVTIEAPITQGTSDYGVVRIFKRAK